MPRCKKTTVIKLFWNNLRELLGNRFSRVKRYIIVRAKGAYLRVCIGVRAAKILKLGDRRVRLKGKLEKILGVISSAFSSNPA